MLDMGFEPEIAKILAEATKALHSSRCTRGRNNYYKSIPLQPHLHVCYFYTNNYPHMYVYMFMYNTDR